MGERVIEKFTAEAMFSKPIFGLDFIELIFVWVRFSEKPRVCSLGNPVVSICYGKVFSAAVRIMLKFRLAQALF